MPHTLTCHPPLHLIEIQLHGHYVFEEAKQLVLEVKEAILAHDCHLILVDARDVTLGLSPYEIFDAPQIITETFTSGAIPVSKIKRAVVIHNDLENARFLETVNVNRAHIIKIFQEMDEAKAWLLQ